MPLIEHKACYGTMFPEPLRARGGRRTAGKVFSLRLVPAGGVAGPDCQVEVNRDE
jgi:hypothetical protein